MFRRLGALFATIALTLTIASPAHAAGPTNTALPTISGNFVSGQILTVTSGNWDSAPSSLLYQWFKCSSDVASSCSSINGATGTSYAISSLDVGSRFQVNVTALSSGGGTTVITPLSNEAVAPAVATSPSVVSGESKIGSLLTATSGSWNVSVTITNFKWQRCATQEATTCTSILGANTSSYSSTVDDIGKYLRVNVTLPASSTYGQGENSSNFFGPIVSVPISTGALGISGSLYEGELVSAEIGSFISYPSPSFSYQWQSCTSSDVVSCSSLVGEVGVIHRISSAEVGRMIRYVLTAQNTLGGIIISSPMSGTITGQAIPKIVLNPQLTGSTTVGGSLQVAQGKWNGFPSPTLAYQWQSCADGTVASCTDLTGESSTVLKLGLAQFGKSYRASVKATNRLGSSIAFSDISPKVALGSQLMSTPNVTGLAIVGYTFTASSGYWNNVTNSISSLWQRCSRKDGSDCVDIAGADKLTYVITKDDEGKYLRIKQWIPDEAFPVYSVINGDPIIPQLETPVVTKPTSNPKQAPKPAATPAMKATTITCVKGTLSKKVTAVSPKCPTGYKKK